MDTGPLSLDAYAAVPDELEPVGGGDGPRPPLSPSGARRVYSMLSLFAGLDGGPSEHQRRDLGDYRDYLGIPAAEADELERVARRRGELRLGRREAEQRFLIDALIDLAAAEGRLADEGRLLVYGLAQRVGMSEGELEERIDAALAPDDDLGEEVGVEVLEVIPDETGPLELLGDDELLGGWEDDALLAGDEGYFSDDTGLLPSPSELDDLPELGEVSPPVPAPAPPPPARERPSVREAAAGVLEIDGDSSASLELRFPDEPVASRDSLDALIDDDDSDTLEGLFPDRDEDLYDPFASHGL